MKKKRIYVKRLTTEELTSMSDDELRDKISYCLDIINNSSGDEREAWEVELTYLQREDSIRAKRYELHAQYVKEIRDQEREFEREEAFLPVGNFDNFGLGRSNV